MKQFLVVVLLVLGCDSAPRDKPEFRNAQARLAKAIADKARDTWMTLDGVVEKVLPDDLKGAKHQRFIVRIGDKTVLVAHNIDIARRVPVEVGDKVSVFGEYEWNERGGVIHFTHRPKFETNHEGGHIEHNGTTYR